MKVIDDKLFTIEWDRGGMQDVRKSHLVLVYEKQKIYSWKTVADHVADTPPSKYQTHGLVDFTLVHSRILTENLITMPTHSQSS